MSTFSKAELRALQLFLGQLYEKMSSAGCNDLPAEIAALFDPEAAKEACLHADKINFQGDPAPEGEESRWPLPDFVLLMVLRDKLYLALKS